MIPNEHVALPSAANENAGNLKGEPDRAFSAPVERAPAPAVRRAETMALAMLRSGVSFMDAADSSGIAVERVMALWAEQRSFQS